MTILSKLRWHFIICQHRKKKKSFPKCKDFNILEMFTHQSGLYQIGFGIFVFIIIISF